MKTILIIINDAPYGSEKAYNALRLAMTLQKEQGEKIELKIFLLADAVFCGLPAQKTADGYYNIERMMKLVVRNGAKVSSCTGCSESRGIDKIKFIEGIKPGTMKELAEWTFESDRVLTF